MGSGETPNGEREQVSPEELLRQLKVSELLLGTLVSLVELAHAKLAEGELDQARLAIEAIRALAPVLDGAAPEDALRGVRQATADLQLAYATAVKTPAEPEPEPDA